MVFGGGGVVEAEGYCHVGADVVAGPRGVGVESVDDGVGCVGGRSGGGV